MRIIDRFDLYMAYKHLNDNQVTVALNLSNGTIGKSRKAGRDLSKKCIEKIENYYTDLNIDWLRTGDGEMIKPIPVEESARVQDKLMDAFTKLVETVYMQEQTIARLVEEKANSAKHQ